MSIKFLILFIPIGVNFHERLSVNFHEIFIF